MISAVVLDMGSSSIKAAEVTENGTLKNILRVNSPPLSGDKLIQECDSQRFYSLTRQLLEGSLAGLPPEVPIGIAVQRSSFLLWDKGRGTALTPLISWQDRRALPWCKHRENQNVNWSQITGLHLSPHYVGPKLAHLFQSDADLRQKAEQGKLLFGTLETYFLWKISKGECFQTDLTMAARTLMADPIKGCWSPTLLEHYQIPEKILPEIRTNTSLSIPYPGGGVIKQTVADQCASLVGITGNQDNKLLVNLGTGGFVLLATGREMERLDGYLSGPLYPDKEGLTQFTLEGTINGISTALDTYVAIEVNLPEIDSFPNSFCLPDTSGIGSPHWASDCPFILEMENSTAITEERKRIVLEGIIFRVAEIVQDFWKLKGKITPVLSGGLASESFLCSGLAACLGHEIEVSGEKETTLLGVAELVTGISTERPTNKIEVPADKGSYLSEKFIRWQDWMQSKVALD